jgi:hypothetical protein
VSEGWKDGGTRQSHVLARGNIGGVHTVEFNFFLNSKLSLSHFTN